ncbi:hypothetical protein HUW46_02421 [Amycolatopsis sp. CA-230715]|nr:hypothetical protein HUW46_02421 [Amycolatopsis sp. CA-230715]
MSPPPAECYDDAWWDSHDRGTRDRPRPGTRVRITEPGRYYGLQGTVTFYEGQWNSSTFPVRIASTGITMLFTCACTEELTPRERGEHSAARP